MFNDQKGSNPRRARAQPSRMSICARDRPPCPAATRPKRVVVRAQRFCGLGTAREVQTVFLGEWRLFHSTYCVSNFLLPQKVAGSGSFGEIGKETIKKGARRRYSRLRGFNFPEILSRPESWPQLSGLGKLFEKVKSCELSVY